MDKYIHKIKIFDAVTIAASATELSTTIQLSKYKIEGFFSIYYEITGDGTQAFSIAEGIGEGRTPIVPSGTTAFATGIVKTSGPGGNGKGHVDIDPNITKELAISSTETGGANNNLLNMWLTFG